MPGGLGGFGLELAGWLIIRGARNIVLSSRNGLKNGYQYYKIQLWRSYGVNVVLSTEDVTTETGVANLLKTANSLGPVIGIFNLAVVILTNVWYKKKIRNFSLNLFTFNFFSSHRSSKMTHSMTKPKKPS